MSARTQYFEHLLNLFSQHIEATDERKEYEIQEKILSYIDNNPVPEYDHDGPYEGDGNSAENH